MKKHINIDKSLRNYFKKQEYKYIFLKTVIKNKNSYNDLKIIKKTQYLLNKLKLKKTKIKNFCSITGRARGVFSFSKLSRLEIRKLNNLKHITGMQKSSW